MHEGQPDDEERVGGKVYKEKAEQEIYYRMQEIVSLCGKLILKPATPQDTAYNGSIIGQMEQAVTVIGIANNRLK